MLNKRICKSIASTGTHSGSINSWSSILYLFIIRPDSKFIPEHRLNFTYIIYNIRMLIHNFISSPVLADKWSKHQLLLYFSLIPAYLFKASRSPHAHRSCQSVFWLCIYGHACHASNVKWGARKGGQRSESKLTCNLLYHVASISTQQQGNAHLIRSVAGKFSPCRCWISSPVYLLKGRDSDRERVQLTDALAFRDGAPHTHLFRSCMRTAACGVSWLIISRQYCFHCLQEKFSQ